MPHYPREFRVHAILTLRGAGYPLQRGALAKVAAQFGVSRKTLARWHEELSVAIDLNDLVLTEVSAIIRALPAKRESATYAQLTAALDALARRVHSTSDIPTEVLQYLPTFVHLVRAFERMHYSVPRMMERMTAEITTHLLKRDAVTHLEPSTERPDAETVNTIHNS